MRRTTATATVLVLLLTAGASACGSSDDGATATTTMVSTSTTTTEATTTAPGRDAGAGGLPSCQEVLQQYTDAFTPDDLAPVVTLFRAWAPDMPDDVAAAVTRIADAYEEAGNLGELDLMDGDLSADAQTFSDWTSDGCPGR